MLRFLGLPRVPLALVAATACLTLAACSASARAGTPSASSDGAGTTKPPASSSSASANPAKLSITGNSPQLATQLLTVRSDGLLTAVTVSTAGRKFGGKISLDRHTWTSIDLPVPTATYQVAATATDSAGSAVPLTTQIKVGALAGATTIGYDITPGGGWVVGVHAPVVIRFHSSVANRAAVERALTVSTSKPMVGSWHWISSRELHFRPKTAWTAHSKVRIVAALKNVRAADKLLGRYDTTIDFTVGDSHVTKVDGKRHTLTVFVNGKSWGNWPTSMGRPEFATRSGNYIVLEKEPTRQMTSCHANITCDKKSKNFYDLRVDWDARLTWSGTFIHSAPWSVAHQGRDNVSHGCINLSPTHAKEYFDLVRYGDLVSVTGTTRGPADLIEEQDPGMTDWNSSWTSWVKGSALGAAITTKAI